MTVVTTPMQWGQPWHGRLGVGSIELEPGTPITSITIDAVTFPILTVSDLGHTRYLKAPGLPVPTTPASITALNGSLLNDVVLFSSELRYSPLSTKKTVANAFQWLLYDGTALRWRKMNFGNFLSPLSTNPASPSTPGTRALEIYFHRGAVFGTFDRFSDDATTDGATYLGTINIPFSYAYTPLTRPSGYPYDPSSRDVSIAVRPDGRAILIRLEAMRWNGYTIADTPVIAGPIDVYDASQRWIFNVWEMVFSDDGSTPGTLTEVWPAVPNITPQISWFELQMIDQGSPWWTYDYIVPSDGAPYYISRYYVPVTLREGWNTPAGLPYLHWVHETSIIVNADYDKDGNKHLSYFRMAAYPVQTKVKTTSFYIGVHTSSTPFDPSGFVPPYSFSSELFHHEPASPGYEAAYYMMDYPDRPAGGGGDAISTTVSITIDPNAICGVYEDGVALKTWDTVPPGTLSWRWKTNNVTELYTGSTSHLRIGPGVVDDTPIASTGYASYNPRTNALVSSVSALGWV